MVDQIWCELSICWVYLLMDGERKWNTALSCSSFKFINGRKFSFTLPVLRTLYVLPILVLVEDERVKRGKTYSDARGFRCISMSMVLLQRKENEN